MNALVRRVQRLARRYVPAPLPDRIVRGAVESDDGPDRGIVYDMDILLLRRDADGKLHEELIPSAMSSRAWVGDRIHR